MKDIRGVLRVAAPLTILEIVSVALALLLLPYLLRVLGPADFGRYAFGVAAGAALAILVDFGFNQLGPKEIARAASEGTERSAIFWRIQLAKLQIAAVVVSVMLLCVWHAGPSWAYRQVLLAATAGVASALLFPQWFLQGTQQYRTLAASQGVARALICMTTLLLVQESSDATLAVLLQASTGCCAAILVLASRTYRRDVGGLRVCWAASWLELRRGLPLFLSTVAISVYTNCVPLVMGANVSAATLGLFGAADRIRGAVQALLAPIGVAAYPQFSVWLSKDRARGLAAARRMMGLQFSLGVGAVIVIGLGAESIIRLLAGTAFLPAVPVAQILAFCIVFTAINNTLGVQIMLSLNEDRAYAVVLGVSAAIGLGLVLLMSQRWGASGAAVAVVATEATVALLMWLWLRRRHIL